MSRYQIVGKVEITMGSNNQNTRYDLSLVKKYLHQQQQRHAQQDKTFKIDNFIKLSLLLIVICQIIFFNTIYFLKL